MRLALAFLLALPAACSRKGTEGGLPAEAAVTGAVSPRGDKHPGEILNEDQVNGRKWTDRADVVPQSIAWVERDAKWVPVTRILVTGDAQKREITRFGPAGEVLEHTLMTAPPGR